MVRFPEADFSISKTGPPNRVLSPSLNSTLSPSLMVTLGRKRSVLRVAMEKASFRATCLLSPLQVTFSTSWARSLPPAVSCFWIMGSPASGRA